MVFDFFELEVTVFVLGLNFIELEVKMVLIKSKYKVERASGPKKTDALPPKFYKLLTSASQCSLGSRAVWACVTLLHLLG